MTIGIDFGTTNSVLALASPEDGGVRVARHGGDDNAGNFRSILCFIKDGTRLTVKAGPAAVTAYLEQGNDCRLIQSVKSLAANPNFSQTYIFGRKYTVEDLIAEILKGLRASAEKDVGPLGSEVTAGRPVRFAGQFVDEDLALKRLSRAYGLAGFEEVSFVAEPLAAAYKFAGRMTSPKTCVFADFGGGTSDFSLVRFIPYSERLRMETLATSGVGIAGDRLDYRIIEHVVCPRLGLGSHYDSMGKRLPIPTHYYARFQRWSDLSFLRAPDVLRELRGLMRMSEKPETLERLIYIIEEELGFDLYRAVSGAKARLSSEEKAVLEFRHGPVQICEEITRDAFNGWIAGDLAKIDAEIDRLFASSGIAPEAVDQVFMIGGTSFVPAIRQLVAARFPVAEFSAEDEFVSVGAGLALHAREHADAA